MGMNIISRVAPLAGLVAILALASCNSYYYPPPMYAPLPWAKGGLDIVASTQLRNDLSIDASYAFADRWMVTASTNFTLSDFRSDFDFGHAMHGFRHFELGAGYFSDTTSLFRHEFTGGLGIGSTNEVSTGYSFPGYPSVSTINGTYLEPYLQFDFGLVDHYVSLVVASRIGGLAFTSYSEIDSGSNSANNGNLASTQSGIYLKEALVFRVGSKDIQAQLQAGLFLPPSPQADHGPRPFASLGISARFNMLPLMH